MATSDPNAQPIQVAAPVEGTQPVVVHPRPGEPVEIVQGEARHDETVPRHEVTIVSHSNLLYWWPVWLCGFVLAAVSYYMGEPYEIGGFQERFYTRMNLGAIFLLTLFSVVLVTNVSFRGMVSALVILVLITATVILAYYRMWDNIFRWFADLNVLLSSGAYFWISLVLFLTWLTVIFIVDRMSYWRVKPGQVTHQIVLGAASTSYDTENLVLEKHRDDLFRHWILGLGTGDITIQTYGAQQREIRVKNVLFVGTKIERIQRLIATEPNTRHG